MVEGFNRLPRGSPPKLRLNSVLNSVTRRGPFLGNSAGVIAMVYNGINSTIGYARGRHDSANSVVAGALSGMLFKSTRGLRPMMISGGLVAGAAGAWAVSSRMGFLMRHGLICGFDRSRERLCSEDAKYCSRGARQRRSSTAAVEYSILACTASTWSSKLVWVDRASTLLSCA